MVTHDMSTALCAQRLSAQGKALAIRSPPLLVPSRCTSDGLHALDGYGLSLQFKLLTTC